MTRDAQSPRRVRLPDARERGVSAPVRLMIYAQDGLGLGHMRRANSIAGQFLKRSPASGVLTVEDSPVGNLFHRVSNHDFVKLPSIEKLKPGRWRAVGLPLPFDDVRTIRAETLRSLVLTYRPDVLLVDHMPHGAMGELRPALEAIQGAAGHAKVVLGLRDILDSPDVIRRRWEVEGAYEVLERYYDLVLVYGTRKVFDVAAEYKLPPGVASKLRYCGYLCREVAPRYEERIRARFKNGVNVGGKLIVAMAGGGADGYPMMRTLLEAMPAVWVKERAIVVMVVGPFMPASQRRDLERRAVGRPVSIRVTVSDPDSYLAAADLVVAMAGYNTTMEVLRSGTAGVLIPRAGPSAEQRTRVRLFRELGWVNGIDADELSPETLADAILNGLTRPAVRSPPSPDLGGLSAAVGQIFALLVDARRTASVPTGTL